MDRRARYDRYIKPYAKPLLALEYLSLPVFSLIIYAFGGSLSLAIVTGLTWLICDALFTLFTGCSLLGIYLRGSPAEQSQLPPPIARGKWIYRFSLLVPVLFLLFLAASDFMLVYIMPTLNKWQNCIYVIFFFQAISMLANTRLNLIGGKPDPHLKYEKQMLVLYGFLFVSMLAILALLIQNTGIRTFVLIIDLILAAFVVYFVYNLITKGPVQTAIDR